MEQVNGWLSTFLVVIETAFEHGLALSILLGWVVAIFGTLYLKILPWTTNRLWVIRAATLPLGAITTFMLWPINARGVVGFFTALAVGLTAPAIELVVVAAIGKVWPDLASRMRQPAPAKP